jgi:hypothetical protein
VGIQYRCYLGVQNYRACIIIYVDNKKVEKAGMEETEVENTDSSFTWAVTLLMINISSVASNNWSTGKVWTARWG